MILYFADRVKGMKSRIMLLTVKEGRPKAFAACENASEIEDTIKSIYEEYERYGENTERILERVFRCVYEESLRQVSVGTVSFDTSNGSENFQNGVHGIIDEMGKRGKKSGGISGLVIGADGTSDEIIRGRSRTITGGTIKFSISDKTLAEQKAAAEKEAKRQAELADYYKSQLKLAKDYRMDPAGVLAVAKKFVKEYGIKGESKSVQVKFLHLSDAIEDYSRDQTGEKYERMMGIARELAENGIVFCFSAYKKRLPKGKRLLFEHYLYLRFLAASDFFFFFTLGLSYCSLFLTSARTPERAHCLLNLRRALSSVSFSLTLISILYIPPSAFCKEKFVTLELYLISRRLSSPFPKIIATFLKEISPPIGRGDSFISLRRSRACRERRSP